jgi:hypothetical protein
MSTPPRWTGLPILALALLALAAAVEGGFVLVAGMAARAISNLSPPDSVHDTATGPMMVAGAVLLVVGAGSFLSLLTLSLRLFHRRGWPSRRSAVRTVVLVLVLTATAGFGVASLTAPPRPTPSMAGLEGAWHDRESRHVFRFNPDGTVSGWFDGLGSGTVGRWSRSGPIVVFDSDRNWRFTGTLQAKSISGTLSDRSTGKPIGPMAWDRRVVP